MNYYQQKNRSDVFISKKMSYCLRHNPGKYGLKLDQHGFVNLQDFLNAMNRMHHFVPRLTEMKIREIITNSNKKRFEIKDNKICALYGHSVPGIIKRKEAVPPKILYHGTARKFLNSIMKQGLLPMGRQYVHLSADVSMAIAVGKRRDAHPVVLTIDAEQARRDGVKFYYANDQVWLCAQVASKYILKKHEY